MIDIPIVPPNPIEQVLFIEICAKVKISEEDPQIIRVDVTVCELIYMSEDFQHTEVLEAHQLLFQNLYLFDTLNFSFTGSDHCMLYLIAYLRLAVVLCIGEVVPRRCEVLWGRVRNWA